MKAAIEYPLKFGPDLQVDIDKWVKWVGDEAEKRLAEFFPSQDGETVKYYLWSHTVVCPSCTSVVPLSPTWWLSRVSNYTGRNQPRKITCDWYAAKLIPDPDNKQVKFEVLRGKKGDGTTIQFNGLDFDPDEYKTVSRSVGKCPNCSQVIEQDYLIDYANKNGFGHQMYAIACKKSSGELIFRKPEEKDIIAFNLADKKCSEAYSDPDLQDFIAQELCSDNPQYMMAYRYGFTTWDKYFNHRQLMVFVTYLKIISEARKMICHHYDQSKSEAIMVYLSLVFDRCIDKIVGLQIMTLHTGKLQGQLLRIH